MWQPIETAPTEGTRVQFGVFRKGRIVASKMRYAWWGKNDAGREEWRVQFDGFVSPLLFEPTHWRRADEG